MADSMMAVIGESLKMVVVVGMDVKMRGDVFKKASWKQEPASVTDTGCSN